MARETHRRRGSRAVAESTESVISNPPHASEPMAFATKKVDGRFLAPLSEDEGGFHGSQG